MIKLKRAYKPASKKDGLRILVERLWPRGVTKAKGRIALWCRDLAPTTELRKWFHAHRDKWEEFKKRYFSELGHQETAVRMLKFISEREPVTFIYAAENEEQNSAVALLEFLNKLK